MFFLLLLFQSCCSLFIYLSCFILYSILLGHMCLEIFPFLLDFPNIFQIFLNDPLHFSSICCNVTFLIINVITICLLFVFWLVCLVVYQSCLSFQRPTISLILYIFLLVSFSLISALIFIPSI
jgi:hypothetical protein